MRTCVVCGQQKPLEEFYENAGSREGRRRDCKACNLARRKSLYATRRERELARVKAWQQANPDKYAQRQRAYKESGKKAVADRKSHLKRKYGLTVEQYEAMLESQGGVCAICREKPGDLPLHVDHHHDSGAVRGLLCVRCNNALGLFKESHDLFAAAADYLDLHDAETLALRDRVLERLLNATSA